MNKKNRSLKISLILTKALIAGLSAITLTAHWIARLYDNSKVLPLGLNSVYTPMLITVYLALAVAFPAVLCLNRLLENVKKSMIFVTDNVHILRLISYFCFAEGAVFFFFGFYRPLSFAISGAALFFGLIMRVLKNVFETAVTIKEENDFTI